MRIRAMDASGDMTFGSGARNFLANTPAAVGQLVKTRLLLRLGEWFIDTSAGVDWANKILGRNTGATRDRELRRVILRTEGVVSIVTGSYASELVGRAFKMQCLIVTQFDASPIPVSVP